MFSAPSFRNQTTPRYDFFRFLKNRQNKKSPLGDFPFLYGSSVEETKGFPTHHDLLCPQRKKALSQDDLHSFSKQRSKIILKQGDPSAYRPPPISPYYQYSLRYAMAVRRLTAKYGMSYLTYFIAFMHRFPYTFCVHLFHNSEFQQIIVVICSFYLLHFLE